MENRQLGGIINAMEEILQLLSKDTERRHIKKHTVLLRQGGVPQSVFIVISGCVKMHRTDNTGQEHIVSFKTTGDIFPECWTFGCSEHMMFSYETVENSQIAIIDKAAFTEYLHKSPMLMGHCFDYMVKNFAGLLVQVTALEQSYASDKLLMTLYYLVVRHGKELKDGRYVIKTKLSHATLASLTGLTRGTVTTELGRLRKKGVIEYSPKRFTVHKQALKNVLGEANFADMQFRQDTRHKIKL